MNAADGVIANLTPFRGIAADPGTVFELGYMCASGKLVAAYTNMIETHYARTVDFYNGKVEVAADGHKRGPDGLSLEDFDMIENLMLHGGVERRGGPVIAHRAAPGALYTRPDSLRSLPARSCRAAGQGGLNGHPSTGPPGRRYFWEHAEAHVICHNGLTILACPQAPPACGD